MGKRLHKDDEDLTVANALENQPLKKQKHDKKQKKEKKDKKGKKDKKDKQEQNDKTGPNNLVEKLAKSKSLNLDTRPKSSSNQPTSVLQNKSFAIHDLINIEHSISVIQDNLAKLMEIAPTSDELSQFVKSLIDSNMFQNGEITSKLLLLTKSHKIQLAAQLKTLYRENKLKIFDQIINFTEKTKLENADDIQLLLKEKKENQISKNEQHTILDSTQTKFLPKLPELSDSILEAKVFIHRSSTNNDLYASKYDQVQSNNERLEYLGDAVLETVVSDILEAKYTDYDEGQLSILRSTLVKNETIEILARAYKFPQRQLQLLDSQVIKSNLNLNTSEDSVNKKIADLFEAYIGALFIDKGRDGTAYDFIKAWLLKVYAPILVEYDASTKSRYIHLSKELVAKYLSNPTILKSDQAQEPKPSPRPLPSGFENLKELQLPKLSEQEETTDSNIITESKQPVTEQVKVQHADEISDETFPITIPSSEPVDKTAKPELYALIGTARSHPKYERARSYKNTNGFYVMDCIMEGEVIGSGEGSNAKDASARAAKAALLNKKAVEKYHLIRMMTPRVESNIAKPEDKKRSQSEFLREFEIPYKIKPRQVVSVDPQAKTKLTQLLMDTKNTTPEFSAVRDDSSQSVLPMFRTYMKINNLDICSCVDASKKKGTLKASQWLLDQIDRFGQDVVFRDIGI